MSTSDLKDKLKRILNKTKAANSQQIIQHIQEEEAVFKQILKENGVDLEKETKGLPRFYYKLPKESETLKLRLRDDVRSSFLRKKGLQLLDEKELEALWVLLNKFQTSDELITYSDYKKVTELGGEKVQQYLTPITFASLQHCDALGRISVKDLLNYVIQKVWLLETRIGLSVHDTNGQGYLRESDLERYISDLIPTLPQLEGLDQSFHTFYVCTAVKKFMFFLDPLRAGRVRILDVLACSFLDDLIELRLEDVSKEQQELNWFSAPSALRVYGQYLNLDRDQNGMLSVSELAGYGSGTLTQPFVERVFQTCVTYNGEMDYKTYLDLVLALENRGEPQALAYLFRILDINSCNYLDAFAINYFFRAIDEQMKNLRANLVEFEDFKNELFDMVKPKDPNKITLNDLITCGKGETFVGILIEFNAFWRHEIRDTGSVDCTD